MTEKDLLEIESSDDDQPMVSYQTRSEWAQKLPGITEDIIRDVSSALEEEEIELSIIDDCQIRCSVLVCAGISWNMLPLSQQFCCIYDVLADPLNDFSVYICACGF